MDDYINQVLYDPNHRSDLILSGREENEPESLLTLLPEIRPIINRNQAVRTLVRRNQLRNINENQPEIRVEANTTKGLVPTDFSWESEEHMMWWMDTNKRRRLFSRYHTQLPHLFAKLWPKHKRQWAAASEKHLPRNPRFQLFNFLTKNGIPPQEAGEFIMDNRELRGPAYDNKAWEDINGLIRNYKEKWKYPTFNAEIKRAEINYQNN